MISSRKFYEVHTDRTKTVRLPRCQVSVKLSLFARSRIDVSTGRATGGPRKGGSAGLRGLQPGINRIPEDGERYITFLIRRRRRLVSSTMLDNPRQFSYSIDSFPAGTYPW
jgi:hypothetical protein